MVQDSETGLWKSLNEKPAWFTKLNPAGKVSLSLHRGIQIFRWHQRTKPALISASVLNCSGRSWSHSAATTIPLTLALHHLIDLQGGWLQRFRHRSHWS